jgi:hypothetical protein
MQRFDMTIEKTTTKRLPTGRAKRQLRQIADVAERNRQAGFTARLGRLKDPVETPEGGWLYRVLLRLERESRKEDAGEKWFKHVAELVRRRASGYGWKAVVPAPTVTATPKMSRESMPVKSPFVVPLLTDDVLQTVFAGIYDREPQIRIIHDATRAFVKSLRLHEADPSVEICRSHVLLKGKPAGCKTILFERFQRWYGPDRITVVDMQAASRAGLENWLLDRAEAGTLADIVFLEEIEKAKPLDNLLPLVSMMGSGYIAKLNARVGLRRQLANILVFATCNNEHVIRTWNDGVLWSRFAHQVHCSRPSRHLMQRILSDKVASRRGNLLWVDKVLELAYDLYPQATGEVLDDPRAVVGLLDGEDRLLNGSYQRDKLAILRAEAEEASADGQRRRSEMA